MSGRDQRRSGLAGWLLAGCVAAVVVAVGILSHFGVADSDFFWHVHNGRQILETGEIPRTDVYSHTAHGEYYAYYSWLAEVLAAVLHDFGGVELIVRTKALGCAIGFLLLFWTSYRRGARGFSIAWALLYGLLLVRFRLYARPEIWTLFLLPVFDLLALGYLEKGKRWRLILLPLLACLWSNLHPYVILGLAVLAAHVVGEALGRALRRPTAGGAGSPLALGGAALACAAATLVNPYGFRIYAPALKLYQPGAIASMPTREWLPPSFDDFALFYVLATAASVLLLATLRHTRIQDLCLWAGTLLLATLSLRNIGVFAMLSTGIVARHLCVAVTELAPHVRRLAPSAARLFHPVTVATLFIGGTSWATTTLLSPQWSVLHQDQSRHYRFGAGLAHDSAPVAALDFIENHRLEGPLFNSWAFGGYVIWRSWPRLLVSIDGRQMLYERFLSELQERGLAEMLRALDIRLGLVSYRDEGAIRTFRNDGSYRLVFFDDLAMVFVRADGLAELPHSLEPYRRLRPEDLAMDGVAGVPRDELPSLLAEAERATRESPGCSRGWMMLGSLARRTGELERSKTALVRAIALDPTQKSYHNNLGIAYLEAGRPEPALQAFRAATALDPRAFTAHYNSGLALAALGRDQEAVRSLRRAVRRNPHRPEAHLTLGALSRKPSRAREHLNRALALSQDPELTLKARELLRKLEAGER